MSAFMTTLMRCLFLAVLAVAQTAQAQASYPAKAIRIIVPYAPGGGNDILARVVAEKLSVAVGQPVVTENKPGAGAIVGTDFVAKAAPDGYTLLMAASGPIVFNPALITKLPYAPLSDLAPISMVGSFPLVLAVHDQFPARNLAELITYSKAHPDKTSYSYPAASFQLVMELVKSRSGLQALNVPYQGSLPSINALLTQEVQIAVVDSGPVAPMLRSGRVRGLAVTSPQRMPQFPNIPTLREQGLDLNVQLWTGLFAPAGTPAPILNRLEEEMRRIMAMPDVMERLSKIEIRPVGSSAAELGRTVAQEIELWTSVAKANNLRAP